MIRPDESFKRSITPASYQPNPQPASAAGKTPGTDPVAPAGPAPAAEPAVGSGQKDVKDVRVLGSQDPKHFDPEQGLTFPGGRTAGISETPRITLVSSLLDADLDAPDFEGIGDDFSDNLGFAKFYHDAAKDAYGAGDKAMANDFMQWAREFDKGVPDLAP